MICKDSAIDLTNQSQQQQQQQHHQNIYNTLQHRRKSQLITFSASSNDIKHNLSNDMTTHYNNSLEASRNTRNSIISNASSNGPKSHLSFAEEDIMIINQNNDDNNRNTELDNNDDDDDDVFRHHSPEADQGVVGDADMDEELFEDELLYCGIHISTSHNANDDSGGGSGSYEDSHALHSSIGGSNRNSLEKDDDDDVDVISTDVSCYDQLVGSAGANVSLLHHDDDADIITLVDENDTPTANNYAKLKITINNGSLNKEGCVIGAVAAAGNGGGGVGVFTTNITKGGDYAGSIYANPFMGL